MRRNIVSLALLTKAFLPDVVAALVPGVAFDRFMTIWLENQDIANVLQNPDFQNLTSNGQLLTNYYALSHPSQPNYIASVGGDYFGLDSNDYVTIPGDVPTIVDLLENKGITWKEYMEDIPSAGFQGQSSGPYARKHNSLISYDSISSNQARLANIVGFDVLRRDLSDDSLPQFSIVVPNQRNDGHDTSLLYGANWTQTFLNPLLRDNSFMNRTLILLTFDENDSKSQPNHIASILLGGAVPATLRGTNDSTFYTHYSMLSTLENNFGLPNLGRYDVGANVFSLVAGQTGYKNNATVNTSKVKLNKSYPGYLNSKNKIPVPPPNPYFMGPGGQGVLPSLSQTFGQVNTPYNGSGLVNDGESGNLPVYSVVHQSDPSGNLSPSTQPPTNSGNRRFGRSTALGWEVSMIAGLFISSFPQRSDDPDSQLVRYNIETLGSHSPQPDSNQPKVAVATMRHTNSLLGRIMIESESNQNPSAAMDNDGPAANAATSHVNRKVSFVGNKGLLRSSSNIDKASAMLRMLGTMEPGGIPKTAVTARLLRARMATHATGDRRVWVSDPQLPSSTDIEDVVTSEGDPWYRSVHFVTEWTRDVVFVERTAKAAPSSGQPVPMFGQ